ncbi:hypothetical protein [Clostridium weizhouense]|uniref:Uncharacterized protein n=1 Tax=Clostridium weizhouense TaxID=2859781 RepID=A0ABS7AJE1_9CLOT|nr:hypothetical protein [Clostridium weizhouense]MBW6408782.1 hypothetical protein [Clostridium weizhouense]
MNKKEIIKQLVKLQILTMRWIERNTNLQCSTHRDMERILTSNKLTCTYLIAINNLKSTIIKYCNNDYLNKEVLQLEIAIKESTIKDLRFGLEPQKKFTEEEKELDDYKLKRTFFMINEMVGIKYIVENLGLTESAVKQACQQERLLNTKKIGKNWMVHIPECRAYWNIPDIEENHLYKDCIY